MYKCCEMYQNKTFFKPLRDGSTFGKRAYHCCPDCGDRVIHDEAFERQWFEEKKPENPKEPFQEARIDTINKRIDTLQKYIQLHDDINAMSKRVEALEQAKFEKDVKYVSCLNGEIVKINERLDKINFLVGMP